MSLLASCYEYQYWRSNYAGSKTWHRIAISIEIEGKLPLLTIYINTVHCSIIQYHRWINGHEYSRLIIRVHLHRNTNTEIKLTTLTKGCDLISAATVHVYLNIDPISSDSFSHDVQNKERFMGMKHTVFISFVITSDMYVSCWNYFLSKNIFIYVHDWREIIANIAYEHIEQLISNLQVILNLNIIRESWLWNWVIFM